MKQICDIFSKTEQNSKPWALWIWNLELTLDEVEKQLKAFISKGFGGVAIRPGRDMNPPFISEEFMNLFENVLLIAQRADFKVRFADDFSLSLSNSFETITTQSKMLRAQYLVFQREVSPSGGEEQVVTLDRRSEYVVLSVPLKDENLPLNGVKQIAVKTGEESFTWKSADLNSKLVIFKKEFIKNIEGGFAPNVLNPKIAPLYISSILELFHARFSNFMPSVFEGFICEMPAYKPNECAIPWDDDLITKYRAKYKRDLLALLPAIFSSDSHSYRIRAQVYDFIFQSMYERFALVLGQWAKKYRLSQWVLCPERAMDKKENSLRDNFVPQERLVAVGMQNLDGTDENISVLRTLADCNSNEYRRETITVIGRNSTNRGATIQSLKSEIDQSLLSGPSKILMDGFYFNVDQRSYSKTPHNVFWYSSEWRDLAQLCTYSSKTQSLIKELQGVRQIAILSPCSTLFSQHLPQNSGLAQRGLEQFEHTVKELMSLDVDIDIISEDLLLRCTVRQNGDFNTSDRIRKGNYTVLILPYAPFISRSVLVFIEKLVSKQGNVIFVEQGPEGTFEDGISPQVTSRIDKLTSSSKKGAVKIIGLQDIANAVSSVKGEISLKDCSGKPCNDIYTSYYKGNTYDIYIIKNNSDLQEQNVTVELSKDKNLFIIDPVSSGFSKIDSAENDGKATICLSPMQTLFIAITPSPCQEESGNTFNAVTLPQRSYRMVLKEQWQFKPLSLNSLPLANWTTRMGLSRETGTIIHFYESIYEVRAVPDRCFFVSAEPLNNQPFALISNGMKIKPVDPQMLLDCAAKSEAESLLNLFGRRTLIYDIQESVVKGFNRISLRMPPFVIEPRPLTYPPLVLGTFSIFKGGQGWALDEHTSVAGQGSWTKYGYPYLSGSARYSQSFEIPNEYKKLILRIGQASGTVYASVNDKGIVGPLSWQPLEADITPLCDSRRNEISLTVCNSFDNILRMNGRPSGLIGDVYIDVY
ncbi:hypothetical protein QA601_13590 [Chitinispirillales bacterium ANBcel5]|uniref:hypothetical protein n=1 Tax=Cellulosispirillum alkaliphilum TaxID=3039283 RepID=UPI002A4FE658|nr:hypothetical protein [Chitinispirillales bacterium ANBcel5]